MIAGSVLLYYGLLLRGDVMDKNDLVAMIEARIKEIDAVVELHRAMSEKYTEAYNQHMLSGKAELNRLLLQLRYGKESENETG